MWRKFDSESLMFFFWYRQFWNKNLVYFLPSSSNLYTYICNKGYTDNFDQFSTHGKDRLTNTTNKVAKSPKLLATDLVNNGVNN